jgi:hypothetical protein
LPEAVAVRFRAIPSVAEIFLEAKMSEPEYQPGYEFAFSHGYAVSDQILTAIGLTVVCHSFIEHQLATAIILLSGVESDIGLTMTSGMSFRSLGDALHGLMMRRIADNEQQAARYNEIIRDIRLFEQLRNQVAHSLWGSQQDNVREAIRIKTRTNRKGFGHVWEPVTVQKISAEIKKAQKASGDLIMLAHGITGTPIPSVSEEKGE